MYFGEYQREITEGIQIITPAISLTLSAQKRLKECEIKRKSDGTIVSSADFACQAVIMSGLAASFPSDKVLGKEEVRGASDSFLATVRLFLPAGIDPVAACGRSIRTITESDHRVWVIDPIDGTFQFCHGGHYAIAMALLVDLQVRVSVVAWPLARPEFTGVDVGGPAIFVEEDQGGDRRADGNER
jgi:3'(2'), 5'-bisphosphate nucleotidase